MRLAWIVGAVIILASASATAQDLPDCEKGEIPVSEGNGLWTCQPIGGLVNPNPALLTKSADGLIRLADGTSAAADANVLLQAGHLESSNVNLAAELIDMIGLARQFELQVRMMQTADDNASRAAEMVRVG